jgi:hypothetical protein
MFRLPFLGGLFFAFLLSDENCAKHVYKSRLLDLIFRNGWRRQIPVRLRKRIFGGRVWKLI